MHDWRRCLVACLCTSLLGVGVGCDADPSRETDAGEPIATGADAGAPPIPSDAGPVPVTEDAGRRCLTDERVLDGACVACERGRTRPAGDDPTGADTACEPVLCAENERVESHACEPCSEDLFNEAGDDASGADTVCDDVCTVSFGVDCETLGPEMLLPPRTTASDRFGAAVAMDGDRLAVSATGDDVDATGVADPLGTQGTSNIGAVYVYRRVDDAWELEAFLKAPRPLPSGGFGAELALDGDTLVVGAPTDDARGLSSGAAFVFRYQGGAWGFDGELVPTDSSVNDRLGNALALDGDTIVAGVEQDDSLATAIDGDSADDSGASVGAAWVFRRTSAGWVTDAYLKAFNAESGDRFGNAVAIESDLIAVSAIRESSDAAEVAGHPVVGDAGVGGAVYLFERTSGVWAHVAYLKASSTARQLGDELAIDDRTVLASGQEAHPFVDAEGRLVDPEEESLGTLFLFEASGAGWLPATALSPFGWYRSLARSLVLNGERIIAGTGRRGTEPGINDPLLSSGPGVGAFVAFERDTDGWPQQAFVHTPTGQDDDLFGYALALEGPLLVSGAQSFDVDADRRDVGAVFTYRLTTP